MSFFCSSWRGVSWLRLYSLFGRRSVIWLGLGILGSALLAGIEVGIALFLQLFLQSLGLLNKETDLYKDIRHIQLSPKLLSLCLFFIAAIRALAQYANWQGSYVTQEIITARLRRMAIYSMLHGHRRGPISIAEISSRIGEAFMKTALAVFSLSLSVSYMAQSLFLFMMMLFAGWRESLVALSGLSLAGLFVFGLSKKVRDLAANTPIELTKLNEGIVRVAKNLMLVRILRTQHVERRRMMKHIDSYEHHAISSTHYGTIAAVTTPFIGTLLILIVILVSRGIFHTGSLTLISFLYLFMRFVQSTSSSVQQFGTANQCAPQFFESLNFILGFSLQEIKDVASSDGMNPVLSLSAPDQTLKSLSQKSPEILIQNLSFRYEGSNVNVFSSLSFKILAGTQFALLGPSGAGKSTFLSLILGLQSPQSGEVKIGGLPAVDYFSLPEVRVGYVGAEAFLVAGTIRENILYGCILHITEDDIWEALNMAKMDQVVWDLPERLEHPILEDGSGLSSGQKQRLCLARAFLNRPQLLVLDEASANLDEETEKEIADSIKKLRGVCTTLVVSHRPGLVAHADEVMRLPIL